MPTLTSDPALTERRVAGLDAYMADRVVRPDAFVCSDYRSYEASHADGFYEGQPDKAFSFAPPTSYDRRH
jgi:hypothetical protein